MKVAIIGQQDFGKAVLEAFLARGDQVSAVFCAPEKEGARPDSLRVAATEKGLKVHQFKSLKGPEAVEAMKAASADIGVMAFVLQFAPQDFVRLPKHGTIQYHPSLLPKYRGPSSINWPISRGETKTGLTIFRPTDGLDEGPIILQKETRVGPDDTLGTVYFDRLFPMGVQAMLEAADLVVSSKHKEIVQDESQATYEGRATADIARIDWGKSWRQIDPLVRGCNPVPGAWTTLDGKTLQVFEVTPLPAKDPKGIGGKYGDVVAVDADGFTVVCPDGRIKVTRVKPADGPKVGAGEWAAASGLAVGARFV